MEEDNFEAEIEKMLLDNDNEKEQQKVKEEPKIPKEDLKIYYDHYYPYDCIYKWLGKNNSEYFERREFSFTSECYLRFQCFKTPQELKTKVMSLVPKKIDFGAVYNTLPKNHNQISTDPNAFVPVEKELVFDIDLTDYDDVRTCCQQAKVCDKCWKFMIISYLILKDILEIDFGFKKICWVFSGRRGIHCWISDDRARKLTNEGRSAVANFIKYKICDLKRNIEVGLIQPIHPTLIRAINTIEQHFDEYALDGQDILNSDNGKLLLKGLIKAYFIAKQKFSLDSLFASINKILDMNINSKQKFYSIKNELNNFEKKENNHLKSNDQYTKTELILYDFMLNILYPRLDINVSKHINHLLKSPFVIHPSTGLVSVPLDDQQIKNFSVKNIPSIFDIVKDHKNKYIIYIII